MSYDPDYIVEPWSRVPCVPRRAPLLEGLVRHGEVIRQRWPRLPLPTWIPTESAPPKPHVAAGASAPRISGWPRKLGEPADAAAVLILWDQWPPFVGECPACGGRMLGTGFGGLLTVGTASGRCLRCGAVGTRFTSGFGFRWGQVQKLLRDTPWRVRPGDWCWRLGGRAPELRAVLAELGETLPRDDEFLPFTPFEDEGDGSGRDTGVAD